MRPEDTVDRKPEKISPATPIITPTSTLNPNTTISDLILNLKSCFQLKDFEQVAAILQSREDKLEKVISDLRNREDELNLNNIELKFQLQTLSKKCTVLEMSSEKFALEKERIEAELKKCNAECEEYRDDQILAKYELEKARLEVKMWREKEVICVERCEKRIAEVEKEKEEESEKMRVEIVKLKEDLEKDEEKRKAEDLVRYWENRYKQIEPKVMQLENDLMMIFGSDPVLAKSLGNNSPVINRKSVNNGNPGLLERQKQSNLSKCDVNAHASPCSGSAAESPLVDTNGPAEAGPNSSVMAMARGNRMPTQNQVVIEIDDSDDEMPIIEKASASKTDKDYGRSCDKDPAFQSISRGKRPLICTQNNGDVGDADGSNQNKKHKMVSTFPKEADESSYLSSKKTIS